MARAHNAQSVGIRSGEDSGKLLLLGKELLGKLIAILNGSQRERIIAILGGQPQILAGGGIWGSTISGIPVCQGSI